MSDISFKLKQNYFYIIYNTFFTDGGGGQFAPLERNLLESLFITFYNPTYHILCPIKKILSVPITSTTQIKLYPKTMKNFVHFTNS